MIINNRFNIVMFVVLIWAGLLSVRLFYFSVINREQAFNQMTTESLEKGRIRAMRGSILSADGQVLAMTRRTSALHIRTSVSANELNGLVEILDNEMKLSRKKILSQLAHAGKASSVVIAENLKPEFIEKFGRYFTKNSALFLKMGFERVYAAKSSRIGSTKIIDGQLRGVSGFEKKYDQHLTGEDLVYEVMIDRQNRIIQKTYKELSRMAAGQDIYLSPEEWP